MKRIILILSVLILTNFVKGQIVINDTVNYKGHSYTDLTVKMPISKITFLANAKVHIKLDVYANEIASADMSNVIGSFEFLTNFTVESNSAFYVPDIKDFLVKQFGILEEDIEVTQGFYNFD